MNARHPAKTMFSRDACMSGVSILESFFMLKLLWSFAVETHVFLTVFGWRNAHGFME